MVSDTRFKSHFTHAKAPRKWKMLTIWWPCTHSLQAYWSLRINNVNPYDTSLLPHPQPIREWCTKSSYALGCSSLPLPLKMLCWNPSQSSAVLDSFLEAHSKHCIFLATTRCQQISFTMRGWGGPSGLVTAASFQAQEKYYHNQVYKLSL